MTDKRGDARSRRLPIPPWPPPPPPAAPQATHVSAAATGRQWDAHFRHELRWSIGLKNVRPTAYRWLLLTHGLPGALLAAVVAARAGVGGVANAHLLAYLAVRLSLAWTTGVWGLGDRGTTKRLWLVPLRDALSFIVWVSGFFSEKIMWRGLVYRVKNGKLFPLPNADLTMEGATHAATSRIAS